MLHKRQLLAKIKPFYKQKLIILLVGSRQVGKTSLMRLIADDLEGSGITAKEQMLFFDFESFDDLNIFQEKNYNQLAEYLYRRANLSQDKQLYVFVDEIQYYKKSSSLFKLLADHYQNIHLILSGSSSLEIKKIFSDRLTGRKIMFPVKPLAFSEYLMFQESKLSHLYQDISLNDILAGRIKSARHLSDFIKELLPIYEDFIIYGSYPRPSLKESMPVREKLLQEIRDTYVRKDISDILRVENLSGFNRLLGMLAAQIGNLVNLQELSSASGLSRDLVERYLFLMQETYILYLTRPWHTNPRQELVRMPKVYFSDTGIRNSLLQNMQPLENRIDKGALAENAVFSQLLHSGLPIKFWRTKTRVEVDYIITLPDGQAIPLEVKYQKFNRDSVPSGLRSFINRYNPPHAFVITRDYISKVKLENTIINFIPALFL